MNKFICVALSLVLAACCLTACSKPDETGPTPEVDAPAVTDFSIGDVETHEPILPWQFEEGEEAENPYYKRTTDEGGNNVYAVLKTADNQVAYLPMSNTVVYVGAEGSDCYFERTTNTYKLDGEDQTVVQFQLYVAEASAKPSTEPDLGETTTDSEPVLPDEEKPGEDEPAVSAEGMSEEGGLLPEGGSSESN